MGFWIALQLLTIIPSPFHREPKPKELGTSLIFFPIIGALTGGLLYGAYLGLTEVFPQVVTSALVIVLWVVFTGAMHLDGFIDTCDGLGGHTRERRLEIMRDSRIGAYGIIGAVLLLMMKFTSLLVLPESWRMETLLLAPIIGCWAMTAAIFMFPYARKNGGLGQQFKEGAGKLRFCIATVIALGGSLLIAGWTGLIMAAIVFSVTLVIGFVFTHRLGGLTGDLYGATRELNETLILLLTPLIAGIF